jgi:putative membrane protein
MIVSHVWMSGWGVLIGLAWVGFWVLLIVLIIALLGGRRTASGMAAGGSALRLLEERYARGEIPREEFLERRTVLRGDQGGNARG